MKSNVVLEKKGKNEEKNGVLRSRGRDLGRRPIVVACRSATGSIFQYTAIVRIVAVNGPAVDYPSNGWASCQSVSSMRKTKGTKCIRPTLKHAVLRECMAMHRIALVLSYKTHELLL